MMYTAQRQCCCVAVGGFRVIEIVRQRLSCLIAVDRKCHLAKHEGQITMFVLCTYIRCVL